MTFCEFGRFVPIVRLLAASFRTIGVTHPANVIAPFEFGRSQSEVGKFTGCSADVCVPRNNWLADLCRRLA